MQSGGAHVLTQMHSPPNSRALVEALYGAKLVPLRLKVMAASLGLRVRYSRRDHEGSRTGVSGEGRSGPCSQGDLRHEGGGEKTAHVAAHKRLCFAAIES